MDPHIRKLATKVLSSFLKQRKDPPFKVGDGVRTDEFLLAGSRRVPSLLEGHCGDRFSPKSYLRVDPINSQNRLRPERGIRGLLTEAGPLRVTIWKDDYLADFIPGRVEFVEPECRLAGRRVQPLCLQIPKRTAQSALPSS
jgi:hypothetical protein